MIVGNKLNLNFTGAGTQTACGTEPQSRRVDRLNPSASVVFINFGDAADPTTGLRMNSGVYARWCCCSMSRTTGLRSQSRSTRRCLSVLRRGTGGPAAVRQRADRTVRSEGVSDGRRLATGGTAQRPGPRNGGPVHRRGRASARREPKRIGIVVYPPAVDDIVCHSTRRSISTAGCRVKAGGPPLVMRLEDFGPLVTQKLYGRTTGAAPQTIGIVEVGNQN
jgi:hypothetical protein